MGGGVQAEAGGVEGAAVADAVDDVLHRPACRVVVEHVVHGDGGGVDPLRELPGAAEGGARVGAVAVGGGDVEVVPRERPAEVAEHLQPVVVEGVLAGQREDDQALAVLQQVVRREVAVALLGAAFAAGEQAAQAAVALHAGGVDQQREPGGAGLGRLVGARALGGVQHQPAADSQRDADALGRDVGADDTREGVGVGDRRGAVAEHRALRDQLVGMARALQEGEVAADAKLDVADGRGRADDRRSGV